MVCEVRLEDLLPHLAAVRVERVEASGDLLRIAARTRDGIPAVCPGCGTESDWVHSRYVRHVADEAVGGRPVVIDLSVRRLYCENPGCPKGTFAEQITGLTVRYQRRTTALQATVTDCRRPRGNGRRPPAGLPAPGAQLGHAAQLRDEGARSAAAQAERARG
ncbi:transposase family protein [Streptomyces sp. YIM S03343]